MMLKKEIKMKLKQTKTWKIIKEAFLKEWGYNIEEHPSCDLIKFLVNCIEKEK